MKIINVIVDEIPKSCGCCGLMRYTNNDIPRCCVLAEDINEIVGNPLDMKYRRSDCPLTKDRMERRNEH